MGNDKYFAALPTVDLRAECVRKTDAYYNWTLTSGRLARWRIAYDTYYGQRGQHNSSWVTSGGEQGELSMLMSNEYRNLLQHLLNLAARERPAVDCVAVNSDFRSQTQTVLGNALVEHYFKQKKIGKVIKDALEISLVLDMAWIFPMWDFSVGQDIAVDPDSFDSVKEGDIRAVARTPIDVIMDFTRIDANNRDWVIVHDYVNKFDLAAQYPEKRQDIIAIQRDYSRDAIFRFGDIPPTDQFTTDEIDRFTLLHARTPAVPQGRMLSYCENDVALFDGPLPFRELPAIRVCPTEQILSTFGYSNGNDLLSLQDVIDSCISAAVTNITSTGVNNIWVKKASNIDFQQLAQGMNLIESDEKPEPLILNKVAPETFKLLDFMIQRMQTISGVNSVARGDLQGKDLSGAAMALLQSMAIQFNSGLQQAYTESIEETGTQIIMQLQDFAKTERVAFVAGKSRKYMARTYSSDKIDKLQRVYVNQANPLTKTVSGRTVIAQDLLKAGLITRPDEYLEVLETGKLEPMIEGPQNELLLMRAENEAFVEGEQVPVVWTDAHAKHIQAHKEVLSNPEARKDAGLIQRVTEHIQEHIYALQTSDPNSLQILGQEPLAPPPPPPGSLAPQGQIGPGPVPGTPGGGSVPSKGGLRALPQPNELNLPNLPQNPMSGEKFNLEDGGLPPDSIATIGGQ